VLRAELDVQHAQEVIDLGQGGDRALASAAARALLDRDRRRNAEDRIDIGARGRLHELACIGVERFEVASVAFGKQHVEWKRALAAARYAGHDRELTARDAYADVAQIVLARVVDLDAGGARNGDAHSFLLRLLRAEKLCASPFG